jgi:hypothetical protein
MSKSSRLISTVVFALVGAALTCNAIAKEPNAPKAPKAPKILEFDTMVGLPAGMTGTTAPIRGINGGGLPWTIGGASGELKSNGHLELAVSGLVFAAGPNTGSNTIPSFRAIVSCLDAHGLPNNVTTDEFAATLGSASAGGGNAAIETYVALPQPCIAPIVFVTSPGGAWFAATGN